MNIFFLDFDTKKCAQYHCDKHVVKMILETAQLLCGVHWVIGSDAPYKLSHFSNQYKHVVIWYNKKHPFSLVDIRNNLECVNRLKPYLLTWESKLKNQMIMYMLRVNSGTNEYKFTEDALFDARVLREIAEY